MRVEKKKEEERMRMVLCFAVPLLYSYILTSHPLKSNKLKSLISNIAHKYAANFSAISTNHWFYIYLQSFNLNRITFSFFLFFFDE